MVNFRLRLLYLGHRSIRPGLLHPDLVGTVLYRLASLKTRLRQLLQRLAYCSLLPNDLRLGLKNGILVRCCVATAPSYCCFEITSFSTSGV